VNGHKKILVPEFSRTFPLLLLWRGWDDSVFSAQGVYEAAIYLGIANQLTNILLETLGRLLHLSDIFSGYLFFLVLRMGEFIFPKWSLHNLGYPMKMFFLEITDQWREFMKEQIARARIYFNLAEEGVSQLCKASRWPHCSCVAAVAE
ncbi:hypothetical protein Prudu_015404, partial [Prunus dulcis]